MRKRSTTKEIYREDDSGNADIDYLPSSVDIGELKTIHAEECGKKLSDEEAGDLGRRLIQVVGVLTRIDPKKGTQIGVQAQPCLTSNGKCAYDKRPNK